MLHTPCFEEPFVICVDASDKGIGGVLGQEENGEMRPVAYLQKLLKHQKRYSAIEKEALVVIKSLDKCEVSVSGKVTVYSDRITRQHLWRMKNKNHRLARWVGRTRTLKYDIVSLAN